jgi:hypothetical protein
VSGNFFPWSRPLKGGVAGREGRRSASASSLLWAPGDGSGVVAERKIIELIWEQKNPSGAENDPQRPLNGAGDE